MFKFWASLKDSFLLPNSNSLSGFKPYGCAMNLMMQRTAYLLPKNQSKKREKVFLAIKATFKHYVLYE